MEVVKDVCTIIVALQIACIVFIFFATFVRELISRKKDEGERKQWFCTITSRRCIYASGKDEKTCRECPEAERYLKARREWEEANRK